MDQLRTASVNQRANIVLACITCENVVLLKAKPEILVEGMGTTNVFLPTVCVSCEKKERMGPLGWINIPYTTAIWTSLSISSGMIQTWRPFSAMKAFLEGELPVPTPVKLVKLNEVKDTVESDYTVQSVLLDDSKGSVTELHLYLQSGFL
jgi:hypothetical protein